jgi:hypothetical protein
MNDLTIFLVGVAVSGTVLLSTLIVVIGNGQFKQP